MSGGPVTEALRAADEFFMGKSKVHRTAETLFAHLREEKIDFALAGALAPVQFPDPKDHVEWIEGTLVLALPSLIELKLASGMTTKDRPRDFDDVIRLIRVRDLPKAFADRLNPFVRSKFDELWEVAQPPEDDY